MKNQLDIFLTIFLCSRSDLDNNNNLEEFILGIFNNQDNKEKVGVAIKLDDDDPNLEKTKEFLRGFQENIYFFVSSRGDGYRDLHKGYNDLWLQLPWKSKVYTVLADDVRFYTENWLPIIERAYRKGCELHPKSKLFTLHQEDRHLGLSNTPQVCVDRNDPWPMWTREWLERQVIVGLITATDAQTSLIELELKKTYGLDLAVLLEKPVFNRLISQADLEGSDRYELTRPKIMKQLLSDSFARHISCVAASLHDNYTLQERETMDAKQLMDTAIRRVLEADSNDPKKFIVRYAELNLRFMATIQKFGPECWDIYYQKFFIPMIEYISVISGKVTVLSFLEKSLIVFKRSKSHSWFSHVKRMVKRLLGL